MRSKFVRDEWEYALSLNKRNFIRPTFWEEPMPEDKNAGLPPASLLSLQFKRVPIRREEPAVKKEAPEDTSHGYEPTVVEQFELGDSGSLGSPPVVDSMPEVISPPPTAHYPPPVAFQRERDSDEFKERYKGYPSGQQAGVELEPARPRERTFDNPLRKVSLPPAYGAPPRSSPALLLLIVMLALLGFVAIGLLIWYLLS